MTLAGVAVVWVAGGRKGHRLAEERRERARRRALRAGRNRRAWGMVSVLAVLVAGGLWLARRGDDGGSSRTAQETDWVRMAALYDAPPQLGRALTIGR